MKKLILFTGLLFIATTIKAQNRSYSLAAVQDTIQVDTWQGAMNLIFGLLPKSHYPTGYLLNKSAFPPKFYFANGQLTDSSFNMFEFYFLENVIRNCYNRADSIMGYFTLDSLKNSYIDTNNILPWGILNMKVNAIKDSAFYKSYLTVSNHRLVENTTNLSLIYSTTRLFCSVPLNMEVNTLNPQFIFKPDYVFSNTGQTITAIHVDLDEGLGYKSVSMGIPFQASYASGGFKKLITRIICSNGDTLYSRSELDVTASPSMNRIASQYQPYDDFYTIRPLYGPRNNALVMGAYPSQFSPAWEAGKYAEIGVWYGCGNVAKKIRKPFLLFSGYNPKDGKSLAANGYAPWINNSLGPILSLEGWRGPMYETYNGFYTDASKNAANGNAFGDNGNHFLDKLRQEGYDVMIVRVVDGIGYLQNNAFVASYVIKDLNKRILDETDGITNPGAALDPEAPNYPNTTVLKKAKAELVVGGLSAGALTTRMALLLMEFEHGNDPCNIYSRPHRTKTWVAIDCENQGSNTPIGFQMFLDFEKSLQLFPANAADVANSFLSKKALDLIDHNGIATQNTLYHYSTMYSVGNSAWNVGHHTDFDNYFSNLTSITPASYPANLKGYPNKCYRIIVSQGSANGVHQLLNNDVKLLNNESPTSWCVNAAGTMFVPASALGFGWAFNVCPYRQANARVLSSWNYNAFTCKFGLNVKTLFYSWHINLGHWRYHNNNSIIDHNLPNYQAYDEAPASTLPSHILLASKLPLSSRNLNVAAFAFCNSIDWNDHQHGFNPTAGCLDLHSPGANTLPRYPNLGIVPGNVNGGMNLMLRNNYGVANPSPNSPNNDFGYPFLTYPNNHYDYTPFDAIWANTTDNTYYDNNTMHVEDPNPLIGQFLVEEIAPPDLYLSNRTIQGEQYTCPRSGAVKEKYYADFEARKSVLVGDQSIYGHNQIKYDRLRTEQGDFVVGDGAVVTMRANNYNGTSALVLGAGFSAKAGSIFRGYIFTDPNMCGPFAGQRIAQSTNSVTAPIKDARPIISTKHAITQNLKTDDNSVIKLYPNPSSGRIYYYLNENSIFTYVITDVTGKKLKSGNLTEADGHIDLNHFDKGVYFITVESETVKQTNRIILQ